MIKSKKAPRAKCHTCKKWFERKANRIEMFCSKPCEIEYNSEKKVTERLKEAKEALKDHSYYEEKLEDECRAIIRLIDKDCKCISCNGKGNQAGHFHSVGSNSSLRFNLHNMHLQDYNCNVGRSANIIRYNIGLRSVYGEWYQEYVEIALVKDYQLVKKSIPELQEAIHKAKSARKILTLENKTYLPHERIELRTKYNLLIGIYK